MIITGILIIIAIPLGTWLITGDSSTAVTVGLWTLLLQPLIWMAIGFGRTLFEGDGWTDDESYWR